MTQTVHCRVDGSSVDVAHMNYEGNGSLAPEETASAIVVRFLKKRAALNMNMYLIVIWCILSLIDQLNQLPTTQRS